MNAGAERVLALLRDGRWHSSAEIEELCAVTCHSRLSDLRAAGFVVEKRRNPGLSGRRMFSWRLAAAAAGVVSVSLAAPESNGAGSGAASDNEWNGSSRGADVDAGPAADVGPADASFLPPGVSAGPPSAMSVDDVVALLASHGLVELVEQPELFEFEDVAA